LSTLPKEVRENFKSRLIFSLRFWGKVGRGLPEDVISKLQELKIDFQINGTTPHGGNNLRRVRIRVPPDHLDDLHRHPSAVTSWKRFAITILKNDHVCKYMGLAPTKSQALRQREIQAKYKSI
jgi:predicted phosphoadenosine phosphosulfate sulfurtransferase